MSGLATATIGLPVESPPRRSAGPDSKKAAIPTPPSPPTTTHTASDEANKSFNRTEKSFRNVIGIAGGISLIAALGGTLKFGLEFPSKFLKTIGGVFASAASIASPVFLGVNEWVNWSYLKKINDPNLSDADKKKLDDEHENTSNTLGFWNKGFYRCASLGFVPFIFQDFVKPETWTKSIFHTVASIGNIPNLLFTGYSWGYGNLQSLIAWGLSANEKYLGKNDETALDELGEIYESAKRKAELGSIANPTLQGLNQWADSCAYITGKMEGGEFWDSKLHGISRLVSLAVGVPETIAKGVDSLVRTTVKEKNAISKAMPKWLLDKVTSAGNIVSPLLKKDTHFKTVKNITDAVFHTLSPLSMASLFMPLLAESQADESIRERGGLAGLFDKVLGRGGRFLTTILTGTYVAIGRLPQSIFQLCYFGRKYYGQYIKKEDAKTTELELAKLKKGISENIFVDKISDLAHFLIEKIIPDFYKNEGIEAGFASFEYLQAKHGLKQLSKESTTVLKTKPTDHVTVNRLIEESLVHIKESANENFHTITHDEESKIRDILARKIRGEYPEQRKAIRFPGADYLARLILKGFDLRSRLEKVDWTVSANKKDDYRNKETAYYTDELWNFEAELTPVVLKCLNEFRTTGNKLVKAKEAGSFFGAVEQLFGIAT